MPNTLLLFSLTMITLILCSSVATGIVLKLLKRYKVFDHPVDRSSHRKPIPRGGGIAVVVILLVSLFVWSRWSGAPYFPGPVGKGISVLLLATIVLALTSWIDDLHTLSPLSRFITHTATVIIAMIWTVPHGMIFQGLIPIWCDIILVALLWLWFVNLFNFMDGIDGIAGVEAISVGSGIAVITLISSETELSPWPPAALAAVTFGFLIWNWQPAKVFLGDVGSIPLGFLLGWLLIQLAAKGLWAPAIILPLYYLSDSTITLARRISRRERIWEAHHRHFYQLATNRGRSHAAVSLAVMFANFLLIGLAALSLTRPWPSIVIASLVVASLLAWMVKGKSSTHSKSIV